MCRISMLEIWPLHIAAICFCSLISVSLSYNKDWFYCSTSFAVLKAHINMLLFKILFFHPNIVICFSTSSPIGLSDMSKCCLCPREAVPNRSPQKEWRSWHQSHTTPPPTADEIFQRGHLPPPLRFYGVPTHVDSLKWA